MWLNICCHTPQFYHYSSINDKQVIDAQLQIRILNTPYSKTAANELFFCLYVD